MFQLINSTWLFAIAALSIPVIIHLWNIRPGKTLKVGSISLIEASSRKNSRSLNLLDVLLLLLRCLFLLILAFLLAQPYWTERVKAGKIKGWVLISKQSLSQVYQKFKPRVDSLTKAGYEIHYFNPGFDKLADTSLLKKTDTTKSIPIKNWVLLKQLGQQVPPTLPLHLFTTNTLNSVSGTRPDVALNLHIQTYTPADSTSTWIQKASFISSGNAVKITEGNSTPSGTAYTNTAVQATEQRNSNYQINVSNGQPSVSFKTVKPGVDNKAIAVDTATLRIAIYTDKNSSGANYLTAALASIKQFTDSKIQVAKYNDATLIPAGQSWLFWLSVQPVTDAIRSKTTRLFVYEPGKTQNIHSWINVPGQQKIMLVKRVANAAASGQILWQDGFGNAVLSVDDGGKPGIYHFYSRFDPLWNDMVWSDGFPKTMLNLLFAAPADALHDKRVIDDQQLLPHLTEDKTVSAQNELTDKTELSKLFWLALIFVFSIERWLAYRTKSVENYD